MSVESKPQIRLSFQKNMLEAAIRIGLVALLLVWCFGIMRPFLNLIVWGAILAIAFYPMTRKLSVGLSGNKSIAAALFTLMALALIMAPIVALVISSADRVQQLAAEIQAGTLRIPPPNDSVANWPVVGQRLHDFWGQASGNLEQVARDHSDQLQTASKWLLTAAGNSAIGVLKVTFSLIIAGVLMAKADACHRGVSQLMARLLGPRGEEMVTLATATVRSVANGVVGVAAIQSILAGISFLVMGIPLAGLWAFLTLIVAIVQLPTAIVFLPIIAWSFSVFDTLPAVLFTVWLLVVGFSDSILKPMLLGRGVEVPMLVILIGAIGGMVVSGIVGLFTGAVVLALAWELFIAWLNEAPRSAPADLGRERE